MKYLVDVKNYMLGMICLVEIVYSTIKIIFSPIYVIMWFGIALLHMRR